MNKVKLIFYVSLVVGVVLFVLESAGYALFGDEYIKYFGEDIISVSSTLFFALKLLGINLIIGIFIAMVYDTVYKALPGGFLRKGLNFAFLLVGFEVVPFIFHFYVAGPPGVFNRLFIIILSQYLIINLIIAFVITGLYDEFYLKAKVEGAEGMAAEKEKEAESKKVKEGKGNGEKAEKEEIGNDSEKPGEPGKNNTGSGS